MGMRRLMKAVSILLITLLIVLAAIATTTQATPKPSVPQFTLKIVIHSYDVAPECTTNPYTGETTITQEGCHVEYKAIDITIQNQPGDDVWYVVQFKGHYTNDWRNYWAPMPNSAEFEDLIHQSSDGDHTVISVPINNDAEQGGTRTNFPEGGVVEFRVQAEKGNYEETANTFQGITTRFNGEISDWSSVQSITIPVESTPTPATINPTITPNPTTFPSDSNQPQTIETIPLIT